MTTFKNLLQNHNAISTKLGTKHPRVKGIQICSKEGHIPFQGKIILKIHCWLLKVFFSRTIGSLSNKLGTKHLWNTQISSNEGPSPFPQWDKCLLPQNLNQTWHKASFGEFDSKLFKGGSRSFSKGDGSNFKPASVYIHSFAQTCCLLGNVAEVSSVANGPLVWFALYTHCNFLL